MELKIPKILAKRQMKHQIKNLALKNLHLVLVLRLAPKTQVFSGYLRFLETALNADLKGLKVGTRIGHL